VITLATDSASRSENVPPAERLKLVWTERLAQVILAILIGAAVLSAIRWVAPVLTPVIVSVVLAYFLDPLIDRFQRRGVNRTIAIVAVATVGVAFITLIAAVVVPTVAEEMGRALGELPDKLMTVWTSWRQTFVERFGFDPEPRLRESLESVSGRIQETIMALLSTASSSLGAVLNLILIPIFTFYFLRDFDRLKYRPLDVVPPRYHEIIRHRASGMDRVVGEWARGQIQVACILAALYATGLGLVGVKLGVFIGLIAGLLNVIPYFGGAIGIGLSVLMALIYGGDAMLRELIGVAVVFATVQVLEGYLITPRLVGEKVGMSPLAVMIVLLLGGSLFGFFGLLLSIPLVAAASVVSRDLYAWYVSSEFYRGRAAPPTSEPPPAAVATTPDDAQAAPEAVAPTPAP
jgi:predicted PurR-regulated permease PerM